MYRQIELLQGAVVAKEEEVRQGDCVKMVCEQNYRWSALMSLSNLDDGAEQGTLSLHWKISKSRLSYKATEKWDCCTRKIQLTEWTD